MGSEDLSHPFHEDVRIPNNSPKVTCQLKINNKFNTCNGSF